MSVESDVELVGAGSADAIAGEAIAECVSFIYCVGLVINLCF